MAATNLGLWCGTVSSGIQAIEKFIIEAESDEYEFEVDGKPQASSEHIKFVRVGEEDGDVENRGCGFWDIYPHTNICY